MTPDQRRRQLMHHWEGILERAGVRRDETEAWTEELWQALRGHGGRLTWLPDAPESHETRQAAPGAQSAAAAAVRAELRPATLPAPPERRSLLGTPPWRTDDDQT